MRRVVMDGTREFPSVQDAAKYIVAQGAGKLPTVASNISHVATQERGTAYGHVWSYRDGKHDLVSVVRCKNCKWRAKPDHSDHEYYRCIMWIADVDAYGFCYRALPKEGDDD